MIFVTLGTQDKPFNRLLEAIDKQIALGNIKDRVVVQAGQTKYESNNMEILGLLPEPEFNKLMDDKELHPLNMLSILLTFEVSKELRFKSFNTVQP